MKEKVPFMMVFILLLGSFFTGILVAVNHYTASIIEKNERIIVKKSILNAFNINYSEDNIEEVFSGNINVVEKRGKNFYISQDKVAFRFTGSGLWGPITGVIALDSDLQAISGLTIIHHEETPGLGGRIDEKEFLDKFKGKKFSPRLIIVAPGKSKGETEVDGITAATLTSKAFEDLLNNEVRKYSSYYKE